MMITQAHQQNHSMITPRAASPTFSDPPLGGYIHSRKFLHADNLYTIKAMLKSPCYRLFSFLFHVLLSLLVRPCFFIDN